MAICYSCMYWWILPCDHIYLKCANNNRATTVVESFKEAVFKFGLPDNFYSNHGGENVNVYRCMIATHEIDY